MIVAQQFTAGTRNGRIVVREADGWKGSRQIDAFSVERVRERP